MLRNADEAFVLGPIKETVPAGLSAVTTPPGTYGFAALFLLSGAMELAVWTQVRSTTSQLDVFC